MGRAQEEGGLRTWSSSCSQQLPNKVTSALEAEGLEVFEALAISEVLALAEQHPAFSIIITPDVDEARAKVIAQHYPTTRLRTQFHVMNPCLN